MIETTMFVTLVEVTVWTGVKSGSSDPVGTFTCVSRCGMLASLTIEAD